MVWPAGLQSDTALCKSGFQFLVPSFFNALVHLLSTGEPFRIIFRTYGTDLPEVCEALDAFAHGRHHLFPGVKPCRELTMAAGAWQCSHLNPEDSLSPVFLEDTEQARRLDAPEDIAAFFNDGVQALAIRDDYKHWHRHRYVPASGKPVWFTASDTAVRHVFFDDNIHCKVDDSIVAVHARQSADRPFIPLGGQDTLAYHNVVLVKASLIEAIQDPEYFIKKINESESLWNARRTALPC